MIIGTVMINNNNDNFSITGSYFSKMFNTDIPQPALMWKPWAIFILAQNLSGLHFPSYLPIAIQI